MNRIKQIFETVMIRSEMGELFFTPILMQFAAHHIGRTYKDFYLDHTVLVEANLACMNDFGIDAAGLISDPYREASAFGLDLTYPEESVPHPQHPLIKTTTDIEKLTDPDIFTAARTRDRIDGTALLRRTVGEKIPVIGWIEGPLAEACDLAGVENMLLQLAADPGFSRQILQKMMPTAKAFALAQIEMGADIIGIGDAICSQISPAMYAQLIQPLHDELFRFVQQHGAMVKLHICGNITHLLSHLAEVTPDIVDIDWMVDMEYAFQVLGPDIIRSGNIDPVAVIETQSAEQVFLTTQALTASERGRPFMLSGGCEITPLTPVENLTAMKKASISGATVFHDKFRADGRQAGAGKA